MGLQMDDDRPIFIQIAERIEDDIIEGVWKKKLRSLQRINLLLFIKLILPQPPKV